MSGKVAEHESRICGECHGHLRYADEYHPFAFCAMVKAGLNPWAELVTICATLGMGEPPIRPRVKHLPLPLSCVPPGEETER